MNIAESLRKIAAAMRNQSPEIAPISSAKPVKIPTVKATALKAPPMIKNPSSSGENPGVVANPVSQRAPKNL